jgi:hypothetical protein
MSKTIPAPPPGLDLNEIPNKSLDEAVTWLQEKLDVEVKPRFLRDATNQGKLTCRIVAQRRRYSTAELYRFIVTLPTATARKEHRA